MAEKKTISAKVLNQAGEEVSKISLKADVWGIEPNKQVMFDAVQVYQSNLRQATAKTKVRHEVSGGGKKPWRQKGTGRARAGSSRSPIWVGGGTVFGPDGTQNFKLSQNKSAHRLALKSALSMKAKKGLTVVDKLEIKNIKTKEFRAILTALKADTKVLVVVSELEMNLLASANNINWVKVVPSDNVSVYDLMNVDTVVIEKEAVKELEEALA